MTGCIVLPIKNPSINATKITIQMFLSISSNMDGFLGGGGGIGGGTIGGAIIIGGS